LVKVIGGDIVSAVWVDGLVMFNVTAGVSIVVAWVALVKVIGGDIVSAV
jgi:hypothetical protein